MRRDLVVRFLAVLLGTTLVLAACDAEAVPSGPGSGPTALAGTSWTVASVAGRLPVAPAPPTVTFSATRATGSGGCNAYGGSYRYDPSTGAIAFADMAMTAMACLDNPRNVFEGAFFGALVAANRAALDPAGRLVLSGPGGVVILSPGIRAQPTA
jgi:heat shock protein HslJ